MKRCLILVSWSLLWSGVSRADEGEEELSAVQEAIASLSSDDFQEREAASTLLWEQGEVAVVALEEASKSADPEVAYRARILWDRIRTGVEPDTPVAIVELVQQYHPGGALQKRRILEALKRANAFAQILRLYHFETDEATKRQCLEVVKSVVTSAVQVALVSGDNDEAISLLRIAPPSEENNRRLVALYRETGRLEEFMQSLSLRGDVEGQTLLMDCYRAKGEFAPALKLARTLGRDDVVASLAVMEGDPLSFLEWRINSRATPRSVRLHLEISREQWLGNVEEAKILAKPLGDMAREGADDSLLALHSLLLNGYIDPASKIMKREYPQMMFAYHNVMEEPWKALELLGYSRDKSVRKKWREEVLRSVSHSWDYYTPECQAYLSVAELLFERGRIEEGTGLLRRMLTAAHEAGAEPWEEFLSVMGERGEAFYEIGFMLLAEEIGPDSKEFDVYKYVSALLGDGEGVRNIWGYLGKVTDLNLRGRFLALGKVYGVVRAPAEEVAGLWDKLMNHAKKANLSGQVYQSLLGPAFYRDDASAILELMVRLREKDERGQWLVSLANFHSFLYNWEESERIWSSVMGEGGVGKRYLASYAGVLLRLGQLEKAHGVLAELDRGALDEPLLLSNIASVLEASGAWDLAATYWRRILLTSSPSSRYWRAAAERYLRTAKADKEWKMVASLSLVKNDFETLSEAPYAGHPEFLLRDSFNTTFFRGMAALDEGDVTEGELLVLRAFDLLIGDGSLADDFFPILRAEGYLSLHDRCFEKAYARVIEALKDFPNSHNSHNGAAWLASRAARRLDEAEEHVKRALELRPRQAAYLDTMAEVWFARHDREKAVMWSERAIQDSQGGGHSKLRGAELRAQYDRFVSGDFPAR